MSDNIIQLNEDLIKHDLKDLVRSSVEETLNVLLDKEADELVNAHKYERSRIVSIFLQKTIDTIPSHDFCSFFSVLFSPFFPHRPGEIPDQICSDQLLVVERILSGHRFISSGPGVVAL